MRISRVAWLAAVWLLATCVSRPAGPPASPPAETLLEAGRAAGQSFVARHAGLDAVEIFLSPDRTGDGQLLLRLRADPHAAQDLAAALPLGQVDRPAFYRLAFRPLPDSERRYYYASFEIVGPGAVRLGSDSGAAYLDGAEYVDGQPADAQTMFRLQYSFWPLLLEEVHTAAKWLAVTPLAFLLYVVPGWALLEWLWPGHELSWPERLGIGAGLSLALYPLLMLWTHLAHLQLGPLYAWLPPIAGLAFLLLRARLGGALARGSIAGALRRWWRGEHMLADLVLAAVAALVLAVRFWVTTVVDWPMWGDSVQHTMIAQLLVDNRGLFDSWAPYAELESFTYHFGFHAAAAALHWATGLPLPRAVLWAGQIANVLAVLALVPLAVRVGGSRWAGVGAVLLAGLLSPMPMYYVNWGR